MFLRFVGTILIFIGLISVYFNLIPGVPATIVCLFGVIFVILAQAFAPVLVTKQSDEEKKESDLAPKVQPRKVPFVKKIKASETKIKSGPSPVAQFIRNIDLSKAFENKWKTAFFVCVALLVISNLLLVNSLINQTSSLTYLRHSHNNQIKANKVLGNLVIKSGWEYSQEDILNFLRQEYEYHPIVVKGNTIKMGSNSIEFENDILIEAQ